MLNRKPSYQECIHEIKNRLAFWVTEDCERILIGSEDDIRGKLDGLTDVTLCYDETRPLATYLMEPEYDPSGEWNNALSNLEDAHKIRHKEPWRRLKEDPKAFEDLSFDFLNKKHNSGNPVCMYVAARIWYGYWLLRHEGQHSLCPDFLASMLRLISPFSYVRYTRQTCKRITAQDPLFPRMSELRSADREQSLHSPKKKPDQEYIIVERSLIPIEKYYTSQFEKWNKYVIECKVCKKYFLADSLKYELCSPECREIARVENRAKRKEDIDAAEVERICTNANASWNNRLTKMKKSGLYPEEVLRKYEIAKEHFQLEKRKKRQDYKKGKISFAELQSWLLRQEAKAQEEMEALECYKIVIKSEKPGT